MSILSKLQSRKLGLIDLLSMGFEVYLKNWKLILLLFGTIYLPFLRIYLDFEYRIENNPIEGLLFGFSRLYWIFVAFTNYILFIAISIVTENYIQGRNISYQGVIKRTFSSLIPLFLLGIRFTVNLFFRFLLGILPAAMLLLIIPGMPMVVGIIMLVPSLLYAINNWYYGLAFILREQRGNNAFTYSQFIVKENWWRVFLFYFLIVFMNSVLRIIFNKSLNIIPFINDFWVYVLSDSLPELIAIGISIGTILLFLNLDFQKNKDNEQFEYADNIV